HPLHFWTPHIDTYIEEFLRLEGRGDADTEKCMNFESCHSSLKDNGEAFRCKDCDTEALYCRGCMLDIHQNLPLHRIQIWTGTHFRKTTLKVIGLRIQLGHFNKRCALPIQAFNDDFSIIAMNGIHKVALDYCGCQTASPKTVQLLRFRLFPSTVVDPKTAATFAVLEHFQLLSFMSQVNAYDFYRTLSRIMDNTGVNTPSDLYPVFLRIVREWWHIRLLKRMGRGHSPSGANGTAEGECAIRCHACLQFGRNIPEDWKSQPEEEKWLYGLFLEIDANFQMKRMNVSSDERDPGLNKGYSYRVEASKFKDYLSTYDSLIPDDKSSCHNHDAIKSASARRGHGTAVSGVGAVVCAQHDAKLPLSIGDLQKGERYVNMDYFFLSSIQDTEAERIVVSYDIACQWSVNLLGRCEIYPPNRLSSGKPEIELEYLVPKFHLQAHVPKCQTLYSFNYAPKTGNVDGEAPERNWAVTNGLSYSTREMGPGSQSDTVDDHHGDYNYRKVLGLVDLFLRKSKEAVAAREEHVEAFIEFDSVLPEEDTTAWTAMCQAWEADCTKPNPYELPKGRKITENDVRLKLAEEDAAALRRGEAITVHKDISPSVLISLGLQLRDLHLQKSRVLERSNALSRRIEAWTIVQHLYAPGIALIRQKFNDAAKSPIAVPDIPLFLPSHSNETLARSGVLVAHEWEFRYAQAHEILNTLRGHLLLRSHMYKSKNLHSRGTRMQTRSLTLLNGVDNKITGCAKSYNEAHAALQRLSGPLGKVGWENELRPLLDSDVTGLTASPENSNLGESHKRLSWIWKVHGTGEDADKYTQAALRIEWCKARARAQRWQEECLLLAEEMRRVTAYFMWEEGNWQAKARRVLTESGDQQLKRLDPVSEGKYAYALRQSEIRQRMRLQCDKAWVGLKDKLTTMPGRDAKVMVECH
ncbi:hypothetical protein CPC08DRAFT_648216, partial [Agrocybe pediades]